jgi:glycosyltransferase 2 family protein
MKDIDTVSWLRHIKVGILGFVVSLIAIYFIVVQINVERFISALITADYQYLIPCMLFLLLGLFTRAIRWRVLLSNQLPFGRAFSIMNVAYLVNGVLPLRIGEVARIYLTTRVKNPIPAMQTASTIVVERLLDLLAVVVMMLLALTVAPVPIELRIAGALGAGMAIGGFIILILVARQRVLAEKFVAWLVNKIPILRRLKLSEFVKDFIDGLMPILNFSALSRAILWTVISWIVSVFAGYILMFAFFEQGDLTATMLYIAAAAFAIALPAVPGNIGTYEASILLALVALGYEQSDTAIAFAITVHAVNVFVHASTGVVGFMREGISLNQLRAGVQQMQQTPAS